MQSEQEAALQSAGRVQASAAGTMAFRERANSVQTHKAQSLSHFLNLLLISLFSNTDIKKINY